uniref:ZP domain-containing protein n=1 Tax=Plectus sambesii TaxID=2011161 RepID=A0A914V6F2_9BILA
MRPSFLYLCLIALVTVNYAVGKDGEISNTIKETPFISCAQDAIYVRLKSTSKFEGNVYLKGQPTENTTCYQVLTTTNQIEVLIPHLECNVQRTRSLNPAGLFIVAIMIISFHEEFVTQGDKVFEIKCFHIQSSSAGRGRTTVPQELSISSSQPIHSLPICRYSVLRDANDNSSLVRFATIGERVYHDWTCEASGVSSMLCLLVTNCFVAEQLTGKRQDLIGDDGCSKDTAIINNLIYDDKLLAARQAVNVFGFADRPQLYFQCQLNLIERADNDTSCPRPDCAANPRLRRDIQTLLRERGTHVLDAASQRVNVLDLEDRLSDLPRHVCHDYVNPLTRVERAVPPGSVCVSKASFGIVIISTILVAVCTLAVVVGNVCRRTSLVAQHMDIE